jgi:hypothetical protein
MNPVPYIDSIAPSSVPAGSTGFQMTITGRDFVNGCVARVDSVSRTTTYISSTQLTAQIPNTDVASQGTRAITVLNPTPGGGISNSKTLTVTGGGGGGAGTGLRGDYFNNTQLTGTPVLSRTDSTVNFNWGTGSPAASVNSDQFSVRWSGQVQAQYSEKYTFYVRTNDGVRLWVNNVLLMNWWFDQSGIEWSNGLTLVAGQRYDIRMEFYDNLGPAEAYLSWSSRSTQKQIIPASQLYPPGTTPPPPPPPPVLYEGRFEAADCTALSGWAADRNRLNTSINVAIYDGTNLLSSVPANLYRADIASYLGDNGLHGFSYAVPASLRDGQSHTISVRYESTTTNLTSSPRTITCAGATPPAAPSDLTATVASSSQINLAWRDNSLNEDGFTIERRDGDLSYSPIASVPRGTTTYQDLNRRPGVLYRYRVKAYNGIGVSGYSNEASATIPGGSTGLPAPPSNLLATAISASQIRLTWTDNSDNESYFKVESRKPYPSTLYTTIGTVGANQTSYTNSGLSPATAYYYRVRSSNFQGDSEPSNVAGATTLSGSIPPKSVYAFSGDGSSAGS